MVIHPFCAAATDVVRIFFGFGPDAMVVEVRLNAFVCVGDWEMETVIGAGVFSVRWWTRICNILSLDSSRVNFATLMASGTLRVG